LRKRLEDELVAALNEKVLSLELPVGSVTVIKGSSGEE
jgi:hypothetical protein